MFSCRLFTEAFSKVAFIFNQAPRHERLRGSGGIYASILNLIAVTGQPHAPAASPTNTV
jgi:hypothetical protein